MQVAIPEGSTIHSGSSPTADHEIVAWYDKATEANRREVAERLVRLSKIDPEGYERELEGWATRQAKALAQEHNRRRFTAVAAEPSEIEAMLDLMNRKRAVALQPLLLAGRGARNQGIRAAWAASAIGLVKEGSDAASDGFSGDVDARLVGLIEGGEGYADPLHFADHRFAQGRVNEADQVDNLSTGSIDSCVEPVADAGVDQRSHRLRAQDVQQLGLVFDCLGEAIVLITKMISHASHPTRLKPLGNLTESPVMGEVEGAQHG
jgi:hypothetical protein